MTRQEIEARIEEIKKDRFFLNMKDRWSNSDYDYDRKLFKELQELKAKLN